MRWIERIVAASKLLAIILNLIMNWKVLHNLGNSRLLLLVVLVRFVLFGLVHVREYVLVVEVILLIGQLTLSIPKILLRHRIRILNFSEARFLVCNLLLLLSLSFCVLLLLLLSLLRCLAHCLVFLLVNIEVFGAEMLRHCSRSAPGVRLLLVFFVLVHIVFIRSILAYVIEIVQLLQLFLLSLLFLFFHLPELLLLNSKRLGELLLLGLHLFFFKLLQIILYDLVPL